MRLIANEKTLPRIHLIGTLLIVLSLTIVLAGYYSWQSRHDAQSSLAHIEQALNAQSEARLKAEMNNALSVIEFTRNRSEFLLSQSISRQVESAHQIANAIYARESGRRPASEVRKLIVETLRPVRFYDGRGYFFIDDMKGNVVLLPPSPQLEGKNIIDNQDDAGHYIMQGLIAAAKQPSGEGFSRYRWYPPGNQEQMADKLSYVRYFEPYDWFIGTGDYLYEWEEMQKQEAIQRLRTHRFGETGYIALIDINKGVLVSPSNGSLESRVTADMPPREREIFEKLLGVARTGGGIVHYNWQAAGSEVPQKKIAYVKIYAPWQWVVVTTQIEDELHAALNAEQQAHAELNTRQATSIALAALGALFLGVLASLAFSRWTRHLFDHFHRTNLAQQEVLRQQTDELRASQRKLLESEHHFRTLANGGNALIWTSGLDKLCNYFNEPWLRYTGRTLAQELGNGWAEGVHPDDFQRCLDIYVSHFERREAFSMEYRLRKANGEYGWIVDQGSPRYDSKGDFLGFIGHCYDITERKRSEEQIHAQLSELQQWYEVMLGREERVLELKDEVDHLRQRLGEAPRYGEVLADAEADTVRSFPTLASASSTGSS